MLEEDPKNQLTRRNVYSKTGVILLCYGCSYGHSVEYVTGTFPYFDFVFIIYNFPQINCFFMNLSDKLNRFCKGLFSCLKVGYK